jgi:hypothetical protein
MGFKIMGVESDASWGARGRVLQHFYFLYTGFAVLFERVYLLAEALVIRERGFCYCWVLGLGQ